MYYSQSNYNWPLAFNASQKYIYNYGKLLEIPGLVKSKSYNNGIFLYFYFPYPVFVLLGLPAG